MTQSRWDSGAPRRHTPFADLFEEAFRLYRRHWRVIIGVTALFQVPLAVATGPLNAWTLRLSTFGLADPLPVEPFVLLAAALAVMLLSVLLGTFAFAAVSYVAGRSRRGEGASAREVLRELRNVVRPLLAYSLLLVAGFLALVLALALVVVTLLVVAGPRAGESGGLGAFLALVAGVAGVVALVAVSTRLALAVPALVNERLPAVESFRRSWALVDGRTWRTFWVLLLLGIVTGLIAGIINPFLIPGVSEGVLRGSLASYAVAAVVSGIVQILLGPIFPAVLTAIYFDYAARGRAG